jgi:NhaP-type Na+/H+ or K+/H+ antiporter
VETLSSVAEGFLFVYLGMSSLSIRSHNVNIPLIIFTIVAILLARFLSVILVLGLMGLC